MSIDELRAIARGDEEKIPLPLRLVLDVDDLSNLELLDGEGHLIRRWERPDRADYGRIGDEVSRLATEFAERPSKTETSSPEDGPTVPEPDRIGTRSESPNGARFVEIAERIAREGGIPSIPDPVAWQREIRQERTFPGFES